MTFLIRIAITFIFLSSCSSLNFTYPYYDFWQNALFRNNINVTDAYIESQEFSFIHVSYKKNDAIFVLSEIENEVFTWVGKDFEKIKTYRGLIVETFGIDPDIKIDMKDRSKLLNSNFIENAHFFDINIDDPSIFALPIEYRLVKKDKLNTNKYSVTFKKYSEVLRWKNNDKIIFDFDTGLPSYSSISISPIEPNINIDFYYKY